MTINRILDIKTDEEFTKIALNLFQTQAKNCVPYKEYISLLGVDPNDVDSLDKIPFLPIEFFKSHKVYCGVGEPEMIFTSSSTTGQTPSKHHLAHISDYEAVFRRTFSLFYGEPQEWSFYALLPSYLERKGSSLIYMMNDFIEHGGGGFYLYNHDELIKNILKERKRKILFGVSYALLDLIERGVPQLNNTLIMETGGMKGRREELSKEQLHEVLKKGFGVETIHSEYGMAELTSQAYSYGDGIFMTPPWMKIMIRDLNDPFDFLKNGNSGGINIIDLANINSCAFIETEDIGKVKKREKRENNHFGAFICTEFTILGRVDKSETRGCNLLIQ